MSIKPYIIYNDSKIGLSNFIISNIRISMQFMLLLWNSKHNLQICNILLKKWYLDSLYEN